MPGAFEALMSLKKADKKHFVTIEDQRIQVSLEDKIKIQQNGEHNYTMKDGLPKLKQIMRNRNTHAELEHFTSDPFWPTEEFVWKK